MAKQIITNSFTLTAVPKESTRLRDDRYYMLTAVLSPAPSADDAGWKLTGDGEAPPTPTQQKPYLWQKTIRYYTDGTCDAAIIEFKGGLGQNGFDYNMVPSTTSITREEDGTMTPSKVSCTLIKRNADGTVQNLSTVPEGYQIIFNGNHYDLGSEKSIESGFTGSSVEFALIYIKVNPSVTVERQRIPIIRDGEQGPEGRGVKIEDVRFRAFSSAQDTIPTVSSDTDWNSAWTDIMSSGYGQQKPYLYQCTRKEWTDNSVEYIVSGPTVWGQSALSLQCNVTQLMVSAMENGTYESDCVLGAEFRLFEGITPLAATDDYTMALSMPELNNQELSGLEVSFQSEGKTAYKLTVKVKKGGSLYGTRLEQNGFDMTFTATHNQSGQTLSTVVPFRVVRNGGSALRADLSDEQSAFATKNDGTLYGNVQRQTIVSMYYGATQQDITSIYASLSAIDGSLLKESSYSVKLTQSGSAYSILVTLKAVSGTTSFTYNKTLRLSVYVECAKGSQVVSYTLQPVPAGADGETPVIYQIFTVPSSISLQRDSSGILVNNTPVKLYVKRYVGESTTLLEYTTDSVLKMKYSYDANQDPTYYKKVTSSEITIDAQKNSLYLALFDAEGALLDRETVPINRDGANGADGADGADGAGINSIDIYRKYTATNQVPYASDIDWIRSTSSEYPSIPQFTSTRHFLWQKKVTNYTDNRTPTTEIILVDSDDNDKVRPQLLSQTDFRSTDEMTEWIKRKGTCRSDALGKYSSFEAEADGVAYDDTDGVDFLEQIVRRSSRDGGKGETLLKPGEWVTLSFYARDRKVMNLLSSGYLGDGRYSYIHWVRPYLRKGRVSPYQSTYRIEMAGWCSDVAYKEGVKLWCYVQLTSSTEIIKFSISSTTETKAFVDITIDETQYVNLRFLARTDSSNPSSPEQKVHLSWYRVVCLSSTEGFDAQNNRLSTFIYERASTNSDYGIIDTSAGSYKLGKYNSYAGKRAYTTWDLETLYPELADEQGWMRLWCSFKLKSTFPTDYSHAVLFRKGCCHIEISMPKLEHGIMPTDWCLRSDDDTEETGLNPRGTWDINNTYYYCNGVRDFVQHRYQDNDGVWHKFFFRMKNRTSSLGYKTTKTKPLAEPQNDTDHWEKATHLAWIVSDAMIAEEIYTDKIITSRIRSKNNTFEVDEDGNVTSVNASHYIKDGSGNVKAGMGIKTDRYRKLDQSKSGWAAYDSEGWGWISEDDDNYASALSNGFIDTTQHVDFPYFLWTGGKDRRHSNYCVDADGTLHAMKGEFCGMVKSGGITITKDNISQYADVVTSGSRKEFRLDIAKTGPLVFLESVSNNGNDVVAIYLPYVCDWGTGSDSETSPGGSYYSDVCGSNGVVYNRALRIARSYIGARFTIYNAQQSNAVLLNGTRMKGMSDYVMTGKTWMTLECNAVNLPYIFPSTYSNVDSIVWENKAGGYIRPNR